MKYQKLAASFAALALTSVAFAADATNSADVQNMNARWLVDAAKLDGTEVYDFHGHKLGDLQQVLIDPKSGRVRYGVLEVDKSWSWNDPNIAVPWGSFAVKRGDDKSVKLSLDATKEKLEKAPKFKAGDADRLYEKQASEPVYSYWSIYWWDEPMPTNDKKHSSDKTKGTDQKSGGTTNGSTGTTGTNITGTNSGNSTTPAASGSATTK